MARGVGALTVAGNARVAVGVIFHSGPDLLDKCLRAIAAQTAPVTVWVHDNSEGKLAPAVVAGHPAARLTTSGFNNGYAGGANKLIGETREPYVLLLNPDVELAPDFVEKILARMDAAPDAGACGGKLLLEPGVLDSTGIFYRRTRKTVSRGEGEPDAGQYPAGEVWAVTGAAIFLRRAALQEAAIGGEIFDPDFFAYREDSDLCWRLWRRGWRVLYAPEAQALHLRGWKKGARAQMSRRIRRHSFQNRYFEIIKNDEPGRFLADLPWILSYEAAAFAYVLLREPFLLTCYWRVLVWLPRMWRKRRGLSARAPWKALGSRFLWPAARAA